MNDATLASPELTGGSGFNFEDRTSALYLAALLCGTTAPGVPGRTVVGLDLQRAAFGQPLDDIIVRAAGVDGSEQTLSLQAKRALIVSSAPTNRDFREVVARAWATVRSPGFRPGLDRVGAVAGSVAEGSKAALPAVADWARLSRTPEGFEARFGAGVSGDAHRRVLAAFRSALEEAAPGSGPADVQGLLASFVLVVPDLMHEGSTTEAAAVAVLGHALAPDDAARASDLFEALAAIARDASGRAGQLTRPVLLRQLRGRFRFLPSAALRDDVRRLVEEGHDAVAEIRDDVLGSRLPREAVVGRVRAALADNRFVQITGLPGVGKSAALRRLVEAEAGPTMVLKADRLAGRGWAAHAAALGLRAADLTALLQEMAATGPTTLYIDGLDRVEVEHRGVVNDVLNRLATRAELAEWRVVATVRDVGLEPLRTWLSPSWLRQGAASVAVGELTDEEAERLATDRPNMRPLLFGEARLREVTRRPFFLSVLSRLPSHTGAASEIDLVDAWWRAGGHDEDPDRAAGRQAALVALAARGAGTLGRGMPVPPEHRDAVAELRRDGVVREVRHGHTVAFSHDVYFEWAFFHALVEADRDWPRALAAAGEPPALGRAVELLSQSRFREGEAWLDELADVEGSGLRPQWTRAWLLGPFASPDFASQAAVMDRAVLEAGGERLSRLLTWFQAEKTVPNPNLVQAAVGGEDVRLTLRLAERFAWPGDFPTWTRLLDWILGRVERFPLSVAGDVASVFEVWQHACSGFSNPRSRAILARTEKWLSALERGRYTRDFQSEPAPLPGRDGEHEELEGRLRALLLGAARAYPASVRDYLARAAADERLRGAALGDVAASAPTLADALPAELVEFTLSATLGELPQATAATPHQVGARSFLPRLGTQDWFTLGMEQSRAISDPASPLRQPFAALFRVAPDEGRRLVRRIANHATTAWRQLHALGVGVAGRPLPLVLRLPWGEQTFWGDARVYEWYRAINGPRMVESGLMALERWALERLEAGREPDDVIHDVLEGQECCSALGVAASVLLKARRPTPAGAVLVGNARLWRWDLQRWLHDRTFPVNLISFSGHVGSADHKAVLAANALPFRKGSLRDLAPMFVFAPDPAVAEAARAAILGFEGNPPIDDAAQLDDPYELAKARRTGAIWSRIGDAGSYTAEAAADGEHLVIQHVSPHADDPDVASIRDNTERLNLQAGLLLWAKECFESLRLSDRLGLDDALGQARSLDAQDLFDGPRDEELGDMVAGAVAGVAAAALRFASLAPGSEAWASGVVYRAARTPVGGGGRMPPAMPLPDHPCVFAARGLAALVGLGRDRAGAARALLELATCPVEAVSAAALAEAMGCWSADPDFAWVALDLGLRLSVGEWEENPSAYGYHHGSGPRRARAALGGALRRLGDGAAGSELVTLPPAWVRDEDEVPRRGLLKRASPSPRAAGGWREPGTFLRWDFLLHVLRAIPLERALAEQARREAFLGVCERLLRWTLDRRRPPWASDPEAGRRGREGTELFEWIASFGRFLGKLGLNMPEDGFRTRFLEPIFALDDELALALLEPLVDVTCAAGVLDPPRVASPALAILHACLDRVLRARAWRDARRHGGDLFDRHLPRLTRDLLWVSHLDAGGASRFANGDWTDLGVALPLVVRLVREVGDVPSVASAFVTLVDQAAERFPAGHFADLALASVAGHGRPVGWRAWNLPERMANAVQMVAEKAHPLEARTARTLLRVLDALVDMGDRRSAALQTSEIFRGVRLVGPERGMV